MELVITTATISELAPASHFLRHKYNSQKVWWELLFVMIPMVVTLYYEALISEQNLNLHFEGGHYSEFLCLQELVQIRTDPNLNHRCRFILTFLDLRFVQYYLLENFIQFQVFLKIV